MATLNVPSVAAVSPANADESWRQREHKWTHLLISCLIDYVADCFHYSHRPSFKCYKCVSRHQSMSTVSSVSRHQSMLCAELNRQSKGASLALFEVKFKNLHLSILVWLSKVYFSFIWLSRFSKYVHI